MAKTNRSTFTPSPASIPAINPAWDSASNADYVTLSNSVSGLRYIGKASSEVKPMPEGTAKERRLAKRKAKAEFKKQRLDLLVALKPEPPDKRISVFGSTFAQSKEEEWVYCDPLWYHISEELAFSRDYAQCNVRKKFFRKEEMFELWDDGYIHGEEAKDKEGKPIYRKCTYSGKHFPLDKMFEIYDERDRKRWVGNPFLDSFQKCDFSGRRYATNLLMRVVKSDKYRLVSRVCVDGERFGSCASCGHVHEARHVPNRAKYGMSLCQTCFDTREFGEVIHPHNYAEYPKPLYTKLAFKRIQGGTPQKDEGGWTFYIGKRTCVDEAYRMLRLFGWEAETEISRKAAEKAGFNRVTMAKQVIDAMGRDFIIVKEDGTLTANGHYSKGSGFSGIEIVSAPADLAVHRERVPLIAKATCHPHFRAWDEYDTCGFHVHVSRDSLTASQVGRMLTFINHKNNAPFVHKVAGRGSDRFCRYIPKDPDDKTHPATDVFHVAERVVNKEEDERRNRSRRVALNLSNQKTVEFRIFRGTIHPRHILRNLEFCDAVCDYCLPCSFSHKDMEDYQVFIRYVARNKKRWPLLAEWLINQKFLEHKLLTEKAQMDKLTVNPANAVETERAESKKDENQLIGDDMDRALKKIRRLSMNPAQLARPAIAAGNLMFTPKMPSIGQMTTDTIPWDPAEFTTNYPPLKTTKQEE